MEVVAAVLAGLTMKVAASRRKDPLPHPFPACMRILSRERRRQLDPTGAGAEIGLVQMAHADEVARFCVEALTFRSVARAERNRVISAGPMSIGWRLAWKRMKRRIHPT